MEGKLEQLHCMVEQFHESVEKNQFQTNLVMDELGEQVTLLWEVNELRLRMES